MQNQKSAAVRPESLDEIVSHSAAIFAEQLRKAAAWAQSELDLQIEAAGALKEFARRAQITLEGHHNVTIATGRPDSVYSRVIVEYKDPGTLSANKDSAANQKLINQLRERFYDLRREQHQNWNSLFGVGTDGKYFIFLRFRDDKWTDQEPLPVDSHSAERFLWALYNLGQKGKPYQPEYLHGDFGSESNIAQEGVRTLYEEILHTENPKAQVFFNQWKILFGEVCGYDVENLSDKLKKLAEFYVVRGKPQPAQLLFAVHTYYAILIKLLAAEIVSFFNPWMPRQVERLLNATTSPKLKRELEELERGGIFYQMGITNFLEGDLFSWYLSEWTDAAESVVRRMITKLDEYNPGTFSEDPVQSRDLLKKLYQQLFPKSVRHDLGEYYTPDWLAEHVLNELRYGGDPDKRILDPACGSGTFLVMAINRIRRWYDQNREKCAYDEGDLLNRILANVIGFDLNPLAVMAARTNYLVAIKDLIRHVDRVEIPVYLCDSIMTPAEFGDLFTGTGSVAKVPCSAMKPPHLLVPKEIANSPREVATYAGVLEDCVRNGYKPDEFVSRCRDEGLNITAAKAHLDLYKELVRLDKENKNGIWARIIKNNFAPLFVGRVDCLAGNPPWVSFDNLPEQYRKSIDALWDQYKLRNPSTWYGRFAKGNQDLSILFAYVCPEAYLAQNGRMGLVITQTLFQAVAHGSLVPGEDFGFRRLRLSHRFIGVTRVDDFSSMRPFEGAENRTSVFVATVGDGQTKYPVGYRAWRVVSKTDLSTVATWRDFEAAADFAELQAVPIRNLTGPWVLLPRSVDAAVVPKMSTGQPAYRAWRGIDTRGANAIFWFHLDATKGNNLVLRNATEGAKKKVEPRTVTLEPELIYPLVRGRDVSAWRVARELWVLYPHDRDKPMPEDHLKSLPKTWSYLSGFRKELEKRKMFDLGFRKLDFYALFQTHEELLWPIKVVWREVSNHFEAAIVETHAGKAAIPDHTVVFVPFKERREAAYFCSVLNSSPFRFLVGRYVPLHPSPHILNAVIVPPFSTRAPLHAVLSALGEEAHTSAAAKRQETPDRLRREIDRAAAKLWEITDGELRAIQDALAETSTAKQPQDSPHNADTE
jgi:SAM-dependent methyltransferase